MELKCIVVVFMKHDMLLIIQSSFKIDDTVTRSVPAMCPTKITHLNYDPSTRYVARPGIEVQKKNITSLIAHAASVM